MNKSRATFFLACILAPICVLSAATSEPNATSKPTAPSPDGFFSFYATNLRASLFSGFLTMGSFLVAVNTFMVVNLKKEVYDHAEYKKRVAEAKQDAPTSSFYGPLRRLSGLVYKTVILAVVTSVSQLTVGVLWRHWLSAVLCLGLAAWTIGMLMFALHQIRMNLLDWFDFIEVAAEAEYKKTNAAAKTPATTQTL